ncbi:MAG TPA: invasion associated locus B family protein [Rhodobacteraceae bacterium]|jgi:invasion protein IalB|nr:invasion associated locus B family protein [Paracoccaceae bacterium]
MPSSSSHIIKPIAVLAVLLAATGGAQAQEASTDAPVVIEGMAPEGPRVGQPYLAGTEGDWEIRCLRAAQGDDPCQMYQLLTDSQGNAVAEFTLFDLPDDPLQPVMGGSITAPLETLLTAQLSVQVDDNPARSYPFSFCTQQGCIATVALTAEAMAEMRAGMVATVTLIPAQAPNQQVRVTASLIGFTAASNRIAIPEG